MLTALKWAALAVMYAIGFTFLIGECVKLIVSLVYRTAAFIYDLLEPKSSNRWDTLVSRTEARTLKKAAKEVGFVYRVRGRPGELYLYGNAGYGIIEEGYLHIEIIKPEGTEKRSEDFWAIVNPLQEEAERKKWEKHTAIKRLDALPKSPVYGKNRGWLLRRPPKNDKYIQRRWFGLGYRFVKDKDEATVWKDKDRMLSWVGRKKGIQVST